MKSLLLTSVIIGAGLAIGIAGMNAVGGVAYQAATTYVQIQQAKDPIYINAQNEIKFTELLNRITKNRHDDFEHYCKGPALGDRRGASALAQLSRCGMTTPVLKMGDAATA
jgi:hypothetical protein